MVIGLVVNIMSKESGRYRRFIGKVIVDTVDINLQQARMGFAWQYKRDQCNKTIKNRATYGVAKVVTADRIFGY